MTAAPTLQRTAANRLAERLTAWLTLARISNSPTVASNVLAGVAVAGVVEPNASVGLLVISMIAFYTAGMLLNDLCDYRWDLEHRPTRPLARGVLSRSAVTYATIALFAIGGALLWLVSARALVSGLVLIGCIVAYDLWHKTNSLSPLVMAACRLMVYVTAFVAFAWPATPMLILAGASLLVHLVGLTAIAKSEARPAVTGYWPAALLFLPPLLFVLQAPLVAAIEAGWVAYSIRFVYRRSGRQIGAAIAALIAGISLVDLLVMAALGAPPLMLALAVLCFGLTLLLQRYIEGT